MISYNKTLLPEGVCVITEKHAAAKAVAVGVFVRVGTRDEKPDEAGISHFIEHLVFKGTKKRTAFQIAKSLEEVGGDLNAYTTREFTCFHALSLKEHWDHSLSVLADLVTSASFPKEEFEREKQVVVSEIHMSCENPDEVVFENFFRLIYSSHPLGKDILGTEDSILNMSLKKVKDFYRRYYSAKNLIVCVAGDIEHEDVLRRVKKILHSKAGRKVKKREKPRFHKFSELIHKQTEQVHILLGLPAPSIKSKLRFEAHVLNALVGGGMTSRLYQNVREKKGLVYSIFSQYYSFSDTGINLIYAATEKENVNKVVSIILSSLQKLRQGQITQADLKLYKTQIKGETLLGSDDVESRMNTLGVNEIQLGRYRPVEEVIKDLEKVSLSSLKEYSRENLREKDMNFIFLGNLRQSDLGEWYKKWKKRK